MALVFACSWSVDIGWLDVCNVSNAFAPCNIHFSICLKGDFALSLVRFSFEMVLVQCTNGNASSKLTNKNMHLRTFRRSWKHDITVTMKISLKTLSAILLLLNRKVGSIFCFFTANHKLNHSEAIIFEFPFHGLIYCTASFPNDEQDVLISTDELIRSAAGEEIIFLQQLAL